MITATVAPTSTLAVLITAPKPVVTPQPISAARSSGMSGRIFTRACSWISMCSAKADSEKSWCNSPPSRDSRGASASPRATSGFWHEKGRPVVQNSQWPQKTDRQVMTWSPGFT